MKGHGFRSNRTPEFVSFMRRSPDWATRALTEYHGDVWESGCVCGWMGPRTRDLKEAEKNYKAHEASLLVESKS